MIEDKSDAAMSEPIYAGDLLYPVKVLGPGRRIGIWLTGCSRGCRNCISPDFQVRSERQKVTVGQLLSLVRAVADEKPVDGITVSGGEPFEQPEALRALLPELEKITSDILVYTGFLKERLESLGYGDILSHVGVLIDGPYIESRNVGAFLRGSDNQTIHFLKTELEEKYAPAMADGVNRLQLFRAGSGFVSVGIVKPGFSSELGRNLAAKGVNLF